MNTRTVAGGFPNATLTRTAAVGLAVGLACSGGQALAQTSSTRAPEAGKILEITAADRAAAKSVTVHGIHTTGSGRIEGGRNAPKTFKANEQGELVEVSASGRPTARTEAATGAAVPSAVPSFSGPGFYPTDLENVLGGAVITSAQFHNVFINCDGSCFAHPGAFSRAFFASQFIHVLDQYTGTTQNGRYNDGTGIRAPYNVQSAHLDDATDIAAIVHAAATTFGTGYNVAYNVFVPPGIDVCVSTPTGPPQCFSPNTPANWVFCAYHSYVDFPDIGHVLYTVIPYPDQALVSNGVSNYVCDVGQPNPTPNGVLADSIASFLDHEMSELITDPDVDAYQAQNSLNDYLSEIGDVCVNPYFLYTPFAVSGTIYYIQPEYSNAYHACVTVP